VSAGEEIIDYMRTGKPIRNEKKIICGAASEFS
jgi:hypothetical protein